MMMIMMMMYQASSTELPATCTLPTAGQKTPEIMHILYSIVHKFIPILSFVYC